MTNEHTLPPLALYIHIPWCVRKCPYCDFNSHEASTELPVAAYVEMLKRDLEAQASFAQNRPITSIFFGGGTPSLMPSEAIAEIIHNVAQSFDMSNCAEITLEANPGASEYSDFDTLFAGGVNRLSFGAQSFNNEQLEKLGRIHQNEHIYLAVNRAKDAGFQNFNIDIMHGLPGQTTEQALTDLKCALSLNPRHISWYQLTIEPNTAFYSQPPILPDDDAQYDIYEAGRQLLADHKFDQYEVSAYSKSGHQSAHNINYWQFGDYLAAGAGAHGKISFLEEKKIRRFSNTRGPRDYLSRKQFLPSKMKDIQTEELPVEFMMNALRLLHGVQTELFEQRTWLSLSSIEPALDQLREKSWLSSDPSRIQTSTEGHYFLNEVLGTFM